MLAEGKNESLGGSATHHVTGLTQVTIDEQKKQSG